MQQAAPTLLAFLLVLTIFTPPAPLAVRGFVQVLASQRSETSKPDAIQDICPVDDMDAPLKVSSSESALSHSLVTNETRETSCDEFAERNDDTKSFYSTSARRRYLGVLLLGVGVPLALTLTLVSVFLCSAIGVFGFVLSCISFAVLMSVLCCAGAALMCGFGVSLFVGLGVCIALVSLEVGKNSMQCLFRCITG
jgi:hypothetical protein